MWKRQRVESCGAGFGGRGNGAGGVPIKPYISKKKLRKHFVEKGKQETQHEEAGNGETQLGSDASQRFPPLNFRETPYLLHSVEKYRGSSLTIPTSMVTKITLKNERFTRITWRPSDGRVLASSSTSGAVSIWQPFPQSWYDLTDAAHEQKEEQGDTGISGESKSSILNVTSPFSQLSKYTWAETDGEQASKSDVQWSCDSRHLITCGYSSIIRFVDVETGSSSDRKAPTAMHAICPHSSDPNLFFGGGQRFLACWDIRTPSMVRRRECSNNQAHY